MSTHAVIARYNEDLTWLASLKFPYTIYNKGSDNISLPSIKLPNIGRESGTFLYYIIENYNSLPDTLIFLQGDPFPHCEDLFNVLENNYNTDIVLPVGTGLLPNNLNVVPQDHQDDLKIIVNATKTDSYYKNFIEPQYKYVHGAQYIVPKEYITNKSLEFWKNLYNANQQTKLGAYVMERMWMYIFDYNSPG